MTSSCDKDVEGRSGGLDDLEPDRAVVQRLFGHGEALLAGFERRPFDCIRLHEAVKAGVTRFHIEVRADQLEVGAGPVIEQEITNIVDDRDRLKVKELSRTK